MWAFSLRRCGLDPTRGLLRESACMTFRLLLVSKTRLRAWRRFRTRPDRQNYGTHHNSHRERVTSNAAAFRAISEPLVSQTASPSPRRGIGKIASVPSGHGAHELFAGDPGIPSWTVLATLTPPTASVFDRIYDDTRPPSRQMLTAKTAAGICARTLPSRRRRAVASSAPDSTVLLLDDPQTLRQHDHAWAWSALRSRLRLWNCRPRAGAFKLPDCAASPQGITARGCSPRSHRPQEVYFPGPASSLRATELGA